MDDTIDDRLPDNERYDKMNDAPSSAQWKTVAASSSSSPRPPPPPSSSTSSALSKSSYRHVVAKMLLILWLAVCSCDLTDGQDSLDLKYRLEEEQDPGTYVGSVLDDANLRNGYNATDLQQMRFRFLRQQTLFTIDNMTGIIRTNSRIDRDTICQDIDPCNRRVDIILQPQQFFRIIRASVVVLDVNDNWPQFDSSEESVDIYESAAVGTIPMVVSATVFFPSL